MLPGLGWRFTRLLGGQAWGEEGVEKRIDVLATALQERMTPQELAELDLSYAPPYSSPNDAVNMAAFVGLNDLSGFSPLITAAELKRLLEDGDEAERPLLLDVRNLGEYAAAHLRDALNVPVDELRFRLEEVPRGRPLVVRCYSGFRSHLALRILKQKGFKRVRNLTGSWVAILAHGGFAIESET